MTVPQRMHVAVIQNDAAADWKKNFKDLDRLVQKALQKNPHLIALPEMFIWRGPARQLHEIAHQVTPLIVRHFCKLAREKKTGFLLGSVLEPSGIRKKYYNTSILINEMGKIACRYRKIHLFDSKIKHATTQESQHIHPGKKIVLGKVWGIPVGLSVCYDLRFPELYRALSARGALLLFVPSNFTHRTGKVHWEVLLRARAIENLAFVAAPGQSGTHPASNIRSFGSSLIVNFWGQVLKRASQNRPEVIHGILDFRAQRGMRKVFPTLSHRRLP